MAQIGCFQKVLLGQSGSAPLSRLRCFLVSLPRSLDVSVLLFRSLLFLVSLPLTELLLTVGCRSGPSGEHVCFPGDTSPPSTGLSYPHDCFRSVWLVSGIRCIYGFVSFVLCIAFFG